MYLPESKTQEGELVVFDKAKVQLQEDTMNADAVKMSPEEWLQKYPDGNYDDARAEYLKSTPNAIKANMDGDTLVGVLGFTGKLKAMPFDTDFKDPQGTIKKAWIKATRVGGSLPFDMVFKNFEKNNIIAQRKAECEKIAAKVESAIKKELKVKNISPQIRQQINTILKGEIFFTFNTFYGVKYPSRIEMIFNREPNMQKIANFISQETDIPLWAEAITNQEGQLTTIEDGSFERINKDWQADVPGDTTTGLSKWEGDLISSHLFNVTFRYDGDSQFRLRYLNLYSQINQRTNK